MKSKALKKQLSCCKTFGTPSSFTGLRVKNLYVITIVSRNFRLLGDILGRAIFVNAYRDGEGFLEPAPSGFSRMSKRGRATLPFFYFLQTLPGTIGAHFRNF